MLLARQRKSRSGATIVEFAVVASVTFFLLLALIVGGLGIFRYQEVAHLAREGARFACTHGGSYNADGYATSTGVPAISSSATMRTYIVPKLILLDASKVTVTASWSKTTNYPTYMDTDPTLVPPGQKTIRNYVSVTVSYQWTPEIFPLGTITLSSTSVMPMSY